MCDITPSTLSSLGDGEHHRASDDVVVRQLAVGGDGLDEVEVDGAGQALRGLAGAVGEGGEGRAGGEAADGEGAGSGLRGGSALHGEGLVGDDGLVGVGHGDVGEGRQDEVASLGARGDEGRGEREDLLGRQRGVEEVGGSGDARDGADEALVAGLDRVDGGGGAQDGRAGEDGGGAQVGRDADLLEDAGGLDHGLGRGEGGAEVVLARLHGLDARLGEGALEELDVGRLGLANGHQTLHLGGGEAEVHELLYGDGGEALLVEAGLEVLEGEGAVGKSVSRLV